MEARPTGSSAPVPPPAPQGVRNTTQPSTTTTSSLNGRIQQTSQPMLGQQQGGTAQNNRSPNGYHLVGKSFQGSLSSNQQNRQSVQMQPSIPAFRSMMPPSTSYPPALSAPAKTPVPPLPPYPRVSTISHVPSQITIDITDEENVEDEVLMDVEDKEESETLNSAAEKSGSSKGLKRKNEDDAKIKEEIYRNIHRLGLEAFNEYHSLIEKISEELEKGSVKLLSSKQPRLSADGFARLKGILIARKQKLGGTFLEFLVSCPHEKSKKRKIEVFSKADKIVLNYPKLCEDLALLIDNEEKSDVIFVIEGEEIYANSSIMTVRSKWFHKLLFDGFPEGFPEKMGQKKKITLEGCHKAEFRIILDYLYTGKLNINNQSLVRLYALALRFELDELEILCIKHLEEVLTFNNNTLPFLLECNEMQLDKTPCGEVIFLRMLMFSEQLFSDFRFDKSNLFSNSLIINLLKSDYLILDKQNQSENEFAICLFAHQWLNLSQSNEEIKETIKSLIRLNLMDVSKLRYLKRLPNCLFDSDTLDNCKQKNDSTSLSKPRKAHPLGVLGGKGTLIINSDSKELVFSMYIPLNNSWSTNTIPVMKWGNLSIHFHPDQSGITLDKLNLSYSVIASPEAFTGEGRLVEATVEMVSPRLSQNSLVLSPQLLHLSRERNQSIFYLQEILSNKERAGELIINDGFVLQIRLKNIRN